MTRAMLALILSLLVGIASAPAPVFAQGADPLPSWNEGAAKRSIVSFVTAVTTPGSPDFVAPEQRVATFDNDGTLWCEQPMYVQLAFALDRTKALAPLNPDWTTRQPFAAVLSNDMAALAKAGETGMADLVAQTHAGMTPEQFGGIVREWLAKSQHPRFRRPYTDLVYQPMQEVMSYLRANGFRVFIVSGGGVEFMRAFATTTYGVPANQIVGSSIQTRFELRDGRPELFRLPKIDFIDDGPGKPVGINAHIGARPIAAFGNSDGDLEMLQWTTMSGGRRLGVIIRHTDADREYAYDRASAFGRLDRALDAAAANQWTVVSMKDDWKRVFAFDK